MSRHIAGLRDWVLQRISAIYLAGFIVYLALHFFFQPNPDFTAWRDWVARPFVGVAFAGFILAVLIHGWVGLRDVVLDYVHHLGLRLIILTLIAFLLAGSGFWAARALILAGN